MPINKVAIIGTVGVPAKYGGFETLTEHLTKHLGVEFDITVFCSSKNYENRPQNFNNSKLKYLPLNVNGVQSIFYDVISIFWAMSFAKTLLILGVSGCIILPIVKLMSSKRIIVNIDGLEWKRGKWNRFARGFLRFSEKIAVNYADEIITDNKVIQVYVKDEYGKDSTLIAYGADHSQKILLQNEIKLKYRVPSGDYAFKVCRIEPENNVHIVLSAFSQLEYPLVIVGNWGNSAYGIKLKKEYHGYDNLVLLDPIYELDKLNQLRSNATIYIHGHSAGGTNPSLVEAMYLGLPVVAFDVNYNRSTTGNSALYFLNSDDLQAIIKYENDKFVEVGSLLKSLALQDYKWEIIAEKYGDVLNKYQN